MGASCSRSRKTLEGDDYVPSMPLPVSPRVSYCPRNAACPPSLLDLAASAIAEDIQAYTAAQIARLPPDLAQCVLAELVARQRLTYSTLVLFKGQVVYDLRLARYSGVDDEWLALLEGAPLQAVDLAHCDQITDRGLCKLQHTSSLRTLCVDHCAKITDLGLINTRGFTRLTSLSLRGCESLGDAALEHLADCTSLTRLSLEQCANVTGLQPITALVQLQCLDLGWCSSVCDDDALALSALTQLTELQLSKTRVTDQGAPVLSHLTALRVLGLAGLQLGNRSVAALAPLQRLESLTLAWCSRVGDAGFRRLSQLASLQSLDASYTAIADTGLLALSALTALTRLNLDSCRVSDRGCMGLTALRRLAWLDLSDTSAADEGVRAVAHCSALTHLNLSYTLATDACVGALAALPRLASLSLDSRLITDAGIAALATRGGPPALTCLDLFGCQVSDRGCAHISKLGGLQSLELCSGMLGTAGVQQLSALTQLTQLSIAYNSRVGDAAAAALDALRCLRHLNLSETGLSSAGLLQLRALSALESLALSGTPLKPAVATKLRQQLPSLRSIKHS